jgi:hypothetical protein
LIIQKVNQSPHFQTKKTFSIFFFHILSIINRSLHMCIHSRITSFLLPIWHILHPLKWMFFWWASLWWNFKCYSLSFHYDLNFTCDMRFFSLWQANLKHHGFDLCHNKSCEIFSTHWNKDFFLGLHCDKTLNAIVLTCITTWVSHMSWDYFLVVIRL